MVTGCPCFAPLAQVQLVLQRLYSSHPNLEPTPCLQVLWRTGRCFPATVWPRLWQEPTVQTILKTSVRASYLGIICNTGVELMHQSCTAR